MFETLTFSSLFVAFLYTFVAAMTPGPNNLMLLSSGLTFGFKRTLPHMLGVQFGFLILIVSITIGVGAAIMAQPWIRWILLLGGALFMLYLAYKTITAPSDLEQRKSGRPIRFWEAVAFQAINPKGWGFGLSYMALVTGMTADGRITLALGLFAVIASQVSTLCSVLGWSSLGQFMSRLIERPRTVRAINVVLGLTLFLMIPLMFWSEMQALL